MSTVRVWHTATLLANGKVLVTGGSTAFDPGYVPSAPIATADLYSPADGSFTPTDSMGGARAGHTATLLPNGKVLVTGGTSDGTNQLNSAELYTYGLFGGFTSTTYSMGRARLYHTATLLPSGKVLLAGGKMLDFALDAAELYDPATGLFTATHLMQVGRYRHAATLLPNGKVLITGGLDGDGNLLASAELYDPASDTWSLTDPDLYPRAGHTATLMRNGKVLVQGGVGGVGMPRLYDPATGTWGDTGSVGGGDMFSMANLLLDGKVLITAGLYAVLMEDPLGYQLYDPAADTFSERGSMVVKRGMPTAVRLADGRVLAMGGVVEGLNTVNVVASAELYSPEPPLRVALPPLLAFYPFEGNAQDASGHGYDGTVVGAPAVISQGHEGQAYLFNGAGDFIFTPLNINPSSYPRLTMGCWALTTAPTSNQALLTHDNGGYDRYLGIDYRGGGIGWSAFTGSGGVLGAVPATLGSWTFMAVMYDQDAQTVRLQVDDMVITKTGVSLGSGLDLLLIAASPPLPVYFKGAIDNVFVFGDVLTDQQLAYIRNGGARAILNRGRLIPGWQLLLLND